MRRVGEEKKSVGDGLFSEVLVGEEPRKRDIKEGKSLMGGVTLVTKSVTIVIRRGTYK